jgi:hypothetical protein
VRFWTQMNEATILTLTPRGRDMDLRRAFPNSGFGLDAFRDTNPDFGIV